MILSSIDEFLKILLVGVIIIVFITMSIIAVAILRLFNSKEGEKDVQDKH